jgi:hypothetical protein
VSQLNVLKENLRNMRPDVTAKGCFLKIYDCSWVRNLH